VRGKRYAQTLLDRGDHHSMQGFRLAGGVEQDAAGRVVVGNLAKSLPEFLMEFAVEALETVGGGARGSASETNLNRQIEDHR
jgi:hypothetical protein